MTKVKNKKKVFVAMSGGVDSSVSAYLLKEAGYDVTGVFMRCYNIDGCAERDAEDARRVAEKLDIPFYVFDFEESYKEKVVEYMVDGYKKGITPNPDVACNREIKFGLFLSHALKLGADYIATGHYVRLRRKSEIRNSKSEISTNDQSDSNFSLFIASDSNKDQSYFLWTLTQNDLKHCLFPVGKYKKPKVREIARHAGLPVADKKDSQGICFLGEVSLVDFLSDYIPKRKGPIVDMDGNKLGDHEGSEFYTIGQRHGLNLAEKNKNLKIKGTTNTKPHYVVEKNVETNTVVVAKKNDDDLFKNSVKLYDLNLISGDSVIEDNLKVKTRIRYRQPLFDALLKKDSKNNFTLEFNNPQKFVAPGQSAVFYTADGEMIGGGVMI